MGFCPIERNPVRAGIVREAWGYEWSSARYHVCIRKKDGLVDSVEMLEGVGDWKEFLQSDPSEIETLHEKVRTGRPRGDDEYVHEAE